MSLTLHTLKPAKGAKHRAKRLGRGNASGHGTYSTRGMKGQRSRSGGRKGLKAMGMRRLILSTPKLRGFRSMHPRAHAINLSQLESVVKDGEIISSERLTELGLIHSAKEFVKILGDGEITKAIKVKGIAVSASAKEKIIKAGGTVE